MRSWKLTTGQKHQVARLYRMGMRVAEIARQFNVSINSVSALAIRRGLRRRKREAV